MRVYYLAVQINLSVRLKRLSVRVHARAPRHSKLANTVTVDSVDTVLNTHYYFDTSILASTLRYIIVSIIYLQNDVSTHAS